MAIQGLNITVTIQRPIPGADDEVGGATVVLSDIATGVRARLSSLKPTVEIRLQGLETSNMYNAVIWPATIDIQENDYLIPENGDHAGVTFKVVGVQIDSILNNSPRAHISVRLQHVSSARNIQ